MNQVHVNHKELYKTVSEMQKVAKSSSIPCLMDNIRIETDAAGMLKLSASNMELYETRTLNTREVTGKIPPILLSAKVLAKLLKPSKGSNPTVEEVGIGMLPGKEIEIMVDDVPVHLCLPPDGPDGDVWPKFPVGKAVYSNVELGSDFLSGLKYVAQAMSIDATRWNLCTVHMGADTLTATDGHRLHQAIADCGMTDPVLIPTELVKVLLRVKSKLPLRLRVEKLSSGRLLTFAWDNWEIKMNENDGTYPNFMNVFPKGKPKMVALVDIERLRKAIVRASSISDLRGANFKFSATKNLSIEINDSDSKASVPIEMNNFTGKDLKIGFNLKYILEALNGVDAETVRIEMWDELSPAVCKFGTSESALVMPTRI